MADRPYNPLSDYLKARYGTRVCKVIVNTGLTCPNKDGTIATGGCIYCDSNTLVPKGITAAMTVTEQIEEGIKRVRRRRGGVGGAGGVGGGGKFIAYFQINTNTYAPPGFLRNAYGEALKHPDIVCIAISTRPDCLDGGVIGLLDEIKKEKDLWIELGLQSSNDETLKRINRGHTAGEFADAVRRAKEKGIDTCAHVILGLPGEGRDEAIETMRFLAGLKVWGVKFHQLDIVRGTPLEGMHERGEVKTLALDEYSALVVECLEVLPPSTVIHRLSGETPRGHLVAPVWGGGKFAVIDRVHKIMAERRTCQGARQGIAPDSR